LLASEYTLLVSSVSFKTVKKTINLSDSTTKDIYRITILLDENILLTSEVVVSANKKLQAVQDVPISLSIIDNKAILDRNIVFFEDALKYVPGVQMNNESISIRGSSGFSLGLGSRVSLLVDGFPMLSGDNGDIKFDIYPAPEIERIEIIKGAGSALYGTGAIGGVVNIISKEPSLKPTLNFRMFSGIYTKPNYQQWQYRSSLASKYGALLSYSQSFGNFSALLSTQYLNDEGYREYDNSSNLNILGKFEYDFSDMTEFSLLTNFVSNTATDWVYWNSLDSATIPPTDTDQSINVESDKLLFASELKHIFSSTFFSLLKVGYLRTSFANTLAASDPEYRQSIANSFNSEVQFNNTLNHHFYLTYGLNYNLNTVKSSTYGDHNQNISAIYGQMEITYIPDLIATAGLRIDYEKTEGSDASTMLSPKLGLNYKVTEETRLRFSSGGGFRAPNVAEKFASVNFQGFRVIPNPELKPEKSWSAEIGINHDVPGKDIVLNFDASAFYNHMNDLIEPTFDISLPNAPIKFQNITEARIIGLELTVKSHFLQFINLQSSITLMDPKDLTLNETLKYRSEILWYTNLSLPFDYIEFQFDYRYLSRVDNIDNMLSLEIQDHDARVAAHILDGRFLVNLYKIFSLPLRVGINVSNALNYYYTDVPGNLGTTRHLSLQLEGSF